MLEMGATTDHPNSQIIFSITGPLMDPTEWTSSYSANDADCLFLRGPVVGSFKHVDGKYLVYGKAFLKIEGDVQYPK